MRRAVVAGGLLCSAALYVAAASSAQQREVEVRDVPIERPERLAEFHDALRALRAGRRRRVRVMHWGDSNVAADLATSVTRRVLQAAYGDGGPGYLVHARFGSRREGPTVLRPGEGWQPRRYGFARDFGPVDGLWGLAGVAVEARRASMDIELPPSPHGTTVEVHALARPGSGLVELRAGRETRAIVPTEGARGALVREVVSLAPTERRATVRVRGGRPVRLLGVIVERTQPGVVYDVFGINGHRVSAQLEWNTELLRAQLHTRAPDLVVLSYGGNEALDRSLSMTRYEEQLTRAVDRIRGLTPHASCLLTSPIAMCPLERRNVEVTRIQREVAERAGCAFFHTAEVSGGHGSLCGWIRAGGGLVSRDGLHLGRRGYAIVGEKLTAALLADL